MEKRVCVYGSNDNKFCLIAIQITTCKLVDAIVTAAIRNQCTRLHPISARSHSMIACYTILLHSPDIGTFYVLIKSDTQWKTENWRNRISTEFCNDADNLASARTLKDNIKIWEDGETAGIMELFWEGGGVCLRSCLEDEVSAWVLERRCLLEELLRGAGVCLSCWEEEVFSWDVERRRCLLELVRGAGVCLRSWWEEQLFAWGVAERRSCLDKEGVWIWKVLR